MLGLYWRNFIVPYWSLVLTAVLCFMIATAAGLSVPIIIKLLIDDSLSRGDIGYLHFIVIGIIILYLTRGLFTFAFGHQIAKAGNDMVAQLREKMFSRLHSLDYAYFINTPAGEIISLFSNDLWLIQQAVSSGIPDLIVESLNVLAIMAITFYFDWHLAMVTFATIPFIVLLIGYFNQKIAKLGMLVEHTLARLTSMLHQSILSVPVIQSYVREDYEYRRFSSKIHQAASELLQVQRLHAILISSVEFLAAIGLTIIIWHGGREVIQGNLTIGGLFAFLIYIINLPAPIRKISEANTRIKLGVVAWQRISSLEKQPHTVPDGNSELVTAVGKVEFKNVSFHYQPNIAILKNINITAIPGDVWAIVGPSGAGKSSFANLLLRFYDPAEGIILIDGQDIRTLKLRSLRQHIGFIQQEPILFHASILENIRYGRPTATFEQVEQAARLANAHDFIMELPHGYDSLAGELGSNLSGGQRQRIAIARAIIMKPAIFLLDEPTAALDSQSEKQVMTAIRNASVGHTTFIITHRLSILSNSDKVIYLSKGEIKEVGTHDQLVKYGGMYAKAVQSGDNLLQYHNKCPGGN
ncbi:MAG: ABC transporter ATP-binding protein [Veillonellales bacterium]